MEYIEQRPEFWRCVLQTSSTVASAYQIHRDGKLRAGAAVFE